MTDYDLYYWPIPFRGQFVRAVLAYAGKSWTEHDGTAIPTLMHGPLAKMPVPFMGPPLLVERKTGFALSQMAAIVLYLGETLKLLPADAAMKALTMKIVMDCNDVIDDVTLDGGRQMWTKAHWRDFQPRLKKWMSLWEETGRRHGLTADAGFLLGGDAPGLADVATGVLWSTMTGALPAIGATLDAAAPLTAGLSRRIAALPALAKLAAKAKRDYGDAWCGGQIEASLHKAMAT